MWRKKVEIHAMHQLTIDGGLPSLALWLSKKKRANRQKEKNGAGETLKEIFGHQRIEKQPAPYSFTQPLGGAGAIIFYLVFVSTHEFTSPNYNALWLHPLYVVLAVLVWLRQGRQVLFALHLLNVGWIAVLLVLFATGIVHQAFSLTHYLLMLVPMALSASYVYVNRLCNRAKVK